MRIGKFEISDVLLRDLERHPLLMIELFSNRKVMTVRTEQMSHKLAILF